MRYELRLKRDGHVLEGSKKRGGKLPDWVEECPGAMDTDDFYLEAFWSLSTCRQVGFSIGSIPWNFIHEYGRLKGLDDENLDAFIVIILTMDRAFLEWELEEAERRRQQSEKK